MNNLKKSNLLEKFESKGISELGRMYVGGATANNGSSSDDYTQWGINSDCGTCCDANGAPDKSGTSSEYDTPSKR